MTRYLLWSLTLVLLGLWAVPASDAYVRSTDARTRKPLFWNPPAVTLTLHFPDVSCVIHQSPSCFDEAAEAAMRDWNAAGARFTFTPRRAPADVCALRDGRNTASFGFGCGFSFPPGTLAVALTATLPTGKIQEADVVFNLSLDFFWDVYTGPQQFVRGVPIYDFYRVASHEFGHVLGLDHPDDYGQRVHALMNANVSNIDRPQPDDIRGIHAIYGSRTALPTSKNALENPSAGAIKSGVALVSGWACEANQIEISFDGGTRQFVPYGSERADTRSTCGDINNGFGLTFNYNNLGDGPHTAWLYVDGALTKTVRFTVQTLGRAFLKGVTGHGTVPLSNGLAVHVQWEEATQGFTITGYGEDTGDGETSDHPSFTLRDTLGTWHLTIEYQGTARRAEWTLTYQNRQHGVPSFPFTEGQGKIIGDSATVVSVVEWAAVNPEVAKDPTAYPQYQSFWVSTRFCHWVDFDLFQFFDPVSPTLLVGDYHRAPKSGTTCGAVSDAFPTVGLRIR